MYVLFPKPIWPLNPLFAKYQLVFSEEQSLGNIILGTLFHLILKKKMRYKTVVLFHCEAFHVIFPIWFTKPQSKIEMYGLTIWAMWFIVSFYILCFMSCHECQFSFCLFGVPKRCIASSKEGKINRKDHQATIYKRLENLSWGYKLVSEMAYY